MEGYEFFYDERGDLRRTSETVTILVGAVVELQKRLQRAEIRLRELSPLEELPVE